MLATMERFPSHIVKFPSKSQIYIERERERVIPNMQKENKKRCIIHM